MPPPWAVLSSKPVSWIPSENPWEGHIFECFPVSHPKWLHLPQPLELVLFFYGGFKCTFCTGGEKADIATNVGESLPGLKSEPWHRLFRWLLAKGCRASCVRRACQLQCLLWSALCPFEIVLGGKVSAMCLTLRCSLERNPVLVQALFQWLSWKQKAPLRNYGAARKFAGFPEALLPSFSPSISFKTGEIAGRIEQRLLSLFPDQKTRLAWCLMLRCAGLDAL